MLASVNALGNCSWTLARTLDASRVGGHSHALSRRWFRLWYGRVNMVLRAFAVHPTLGFVLVKRERNGDELITGIAVTVIAGYHDTDITNLHLRPSIFGDGVDPEQTVAPVRGENGDKVQEEGRRRGVRGSSVDKSQEESEREDTT